MSVQTSFDVYCDICGTWERCGSDGVKEARVRAAKNHGFSRVSVGGKLMDLCYACTKAQRDVEHTRVAW